ncbi:urea amidolyase family protein [Pseudorhodoferax sp. Leaf274]|uniref:5-oxoprolinase subunit B/C family protein n=1 Tax=Pseudorhodoferax sp. Leaf274 TaxID=1736318 RepID=UPI000702971A|nr:urea amidolyase family protein [Pseudorhodoferax sp. Leaf274]KQP35884.1 allophanate hydrolase [Pseudorhodoferax sp. Leaf274]
MRLLPVNLDALLVELDDLPQTLALLASLQERPIAGVDELVPAARTILVRYRPAAVSAAALAKDIAGRRLDRQVERAGTRIEIEVDYDGEDLDEVAQILGATREEVIAWHTGSDYTVAFTGFAPGFAYLSGGDPRLDVPRRKTPRTRVPAGAVALAGTFSAVYPQASPGGWQLLGVTHTPMWDLAQAVPALLQPGFRVRFVDAARRPPRARTAAHAVAPAVAGTAAPAPGMAAGPAGAVLEVRNAGLQAVFQDLGRHGQAGQGVSASGALDQGALRAANRAVGNPCDAAAIEIVDGGFELCSQGDTVLAVAGADGPLHLVAPDGRRWPQPRGQALALSDGDRLVVGAPRAGVRSYLAVRGGFAVAPVLGSCATDTLAKVGPDPIRTGDRLAVRPAVRGTVGTPELAPGDLPTAQDIVVLDVVMGPRTDWFTPEAVALLAQQLWSVTPQSNRVGLRLAGEQPLARSQPAELPSEGTALGAIQVPASGQPVLFLADHPLTGGYPVIGAVAPHHLDLAGQIPIGARIRFNPIRPFAPITP